MTETKNNHPPPPKFQQHTIMKIHHILAALITHLPLTAPAQQPTFDLKNWQQNNTQKIDLKTWSKHNPSPYRSYFSPTSTDCTKRWFISLGPLGLNTLMHDRSWGIFPACREIEPKALADKNGLLFNNFQVLSVKPNSPASEKILPGDLILGLDGHPLLAAQHLLLDRPVDNKTKRGLEIHAGTIIDAAESTGKITLNILRLPENLKNTPIKTDRTWTEIQKIDTTKTTQINIPLENADLAKISPIGKTRGLKLQNLALKHTSGKTIPIDIGGKRRDTALNVNLEIPSGEWTLTGTITTNKPAQISILTTPKPSLPENLKPYLKKITLHLAPIGSFGNTFDPETPKARNYAKMLAHRLAAQQEPDGSWSAKSYASPSFYTSICGLALLSTDNPAYHQNIRRAAQYIAYTGQKDKWTYSNGMWLLFLSEYYLKTKDTTILPAIKMHIANCRRFIMSDYTAGHSYAQPGYGGSGYIGGGGVIACALATASKTPAMTPDDLNTLDRMLSRVQEIAKGGLVPYGRSGRAKHQIAATGQGGSCGTGPYYIASLIRGGAETFTKNATTRYSTAPFGTAENGHATQTLHFFWASLSTANCGPEPHRQNMTDYLWKFTNTRETNGLINKNNYRTEYHNGDGVIGEPYWRTAAYIILMNAHQRNLAITGNPKYRTAPRTNTIVSHNDRALHNNTLRNWTLVENYLGKTAPPAFTKTLAKLRALNPDPTLGINLRQLLTTEAPEAAKQILALKNTPAPIPPAQLAELTLGITFQASCAPDLSTDDEDEDLGTGAKKDKKADKKAAKAAAKKLKKDIQNGKITSLTHTLYIHPTNKLQTDPKNTSEEQTTSLFPITNLKIQLADPTKKLLQKPTPLDTKNPPTFTLNLKEQKQLALRITYTAAGQEFTYTTTLEIPAPIHRNYIPTLKCIPFTATVTEDYADSYSPIILTQNGQTIGCEQRNKPAPYLLSGSKYTFEISPGSIWGHDLRTAKSLTPNHRLAIPTTTEGTDKPALLSDHNPETGITLPPGKTTLTFHLKEPTTIHSLYIHFKNNKNGTTEIPHTLEAWQDGKWQLLRNVRIPGLHPTITHTTNKIRLTLNNGKTPATLTETHLITPPTTPTKTHYSW